MSPNPVLTEVWRGPNIESSHRGAYTVTTELRPTRHRGNQRTRCFLRSIAKPFQTIAVLSAGVPEAFGLTTREIAIMTASHSGEPDHVRTVAGLLKKGGLKPSDLQCGLHAPFHRGSSDELIRRRQKLTVLHNNCSGKHAGMLLLAKCLGAPLRDYLDPDHAVQKRIIRVLSDFTGVAPRQIAIATDGCSAPTFALSLPAIARGYERLANPERRGIRPEDAAAALRLHEAVAAYPRTIAGTGRLSTKLLQIRGDILFPKNGAEGLYAVGVRASESGKRKGHGLAVKIDDGQDRGYLRLVVDMLRSLGDLTAAEARAALDPSFIEIRNHSGRLVGRIVSTQ